MHTKKSHKICAFVLVLSLGLSGVLSGCTLNHTVKETPLFSAANEHAERFMRQVSNLSEDYVSLEDAAVVLREAMVNRQESIDLYVHSDSAIDTNTIAQLMTKACAESADGAWNTGDYLYWSIGDGSETRLNFSYESLDRKNWHIKVSGLSYKTTVEQEQQVMAELSALRDELGLDEDNLSNEDKIKRIYAWITDNVTYDHDSLALNGDGDPANDTIMCYTPYAALMNRTAVCQGYASLFYAMCHMVGVPARIVYGKGDGGDGVWADHAWNIVQVNDGWYQFDATWDAGRPAWAWRYYAKGTEKMAENHQLDTEITGPDYIHQWNGNNETIA